MNEHDRIGELVQKYLSGTSSADEVAELFDLLRGGGHDELISELIAQQAPDAGDQHEQVAPYDAERWEPVLAAVMEGRSPGSGQNQPRIFPWRRLAIAACLLILLGFGVYSFWPGKKDRALAGTVRKSNSGKDLPAGKDGAILTLQDGTQILLDTLADGTLTLGDNPGVTKKGGMLSYDVNGGSNADLADTGYNVLSTPRGRQFRLVLPDGTLVYLNAMSSIRYPAIFDKSHRTVQLTGEGYFEVAKDPSKPFHVKIMATDGTGAETDVQAIGTGFNINAYDDEPAVLTTLVEGVVKLTRGADEKMMTPGQQAVTVNSAAGIKIKTVDTEQVLGWKNGYFILADTRIHTLMRQLARWYDLEVAYTGTFEGDDFAGEIPRSASLSKVLEMLELTGVVRFEIEGRKVTVIPGTQH